jgi:hypothetical protein
MTSAASSTPAAAAIAAGFVSDRATPIDPTFHPVTEGHPVETHHQLAKKTVTDADIRCTGQVAIQRTQTTKVCGKLLAIKAGRPWAIQCPRCHTVNTSPPIP